MRLGGWRQARARAVFQLQRREGGLYQPTAHAPVWLLFVFPGIIPVVVKQNVAVILAHELLTLATSYSTGDRLATDT